MRRRLRIGAAGGVLLALAVAGCSNGTNGAASAGPPRPGGTLTLGIATNPECIDPQQAGANGEVNVARQLVDSLTDQDPRTGALRPWLATSWRSSADATRFTFHLRKGATFSDGTPVDAAALRANLDGIVRLGARSPIAGSYLAGYAGTTVDDPYTATVRFRTPSAQFLQATSTPSLGLLSPRSVAADPGGRCHGTRLVGSGPFVFSGYQQNQQVVLRKRSGYDWGSPLWRHHGAAYLDRIVFRVLPEPGVRTGAVQSHQVDAITDVQPSDEATLTKSGVTELIRANPGFVFSLYPNVSRAPLKDPVVRQAIQLGVNRREVVDTVLTRSYRPASSVLARSTPTYTDLSAKLAYDPAAARAALARDGWRAGAGGIRTKAGHALRVDVVFTATFNQSQQVLELVQQQLRAIGVDLRLRPTTPGELTSVQQAGTYDFSWGNLTRADPDILRTLFSTRFHNADRLTDSPLEKDLTAQAATLDPKRRAALSGRVQTALVAGGYAIPVFELTQVVGLGPAAHGIGFEASSRLQLHDAWTSR